MSGIVLPLPDADLVGPVAACVPCFCTLASAIHPCRLQMAKHASRGGGGAAGEEPDSRYAGVDASFHTAEWHAARLAALQMERPRWGFGLTADVGVERNLRCRALCKAQVQTFLLGTLHPPAGCCACPLCPSCQAAPAGDARVHPVFACAVGTTGRSSRTRRLHGKRRWKPRWRRRRVSSMAGRVAAGSAPASTALLLVMSA